MAGVFTRYYKKSTGEAHFINNGSVSISMTVSPVTKPIGKISAPRNEFRLWLKYAHYSHYYLSERFCCHVKLCETEKTPQFLIPTFVFVGIQHTRTDG